MGEHPSAKQTELTVWVSTTGIARAIPLFLIVQTGHGAFSSLLVDTPLIDMAILGTLREPCGQETGQRVVQVR